ncbi:MAG: (2Fe-2S)-binding protein, partial [Lentisphaeria bacterium]
RSCLTKVSSVVGKRITTIEGFEQSDGTLHPIQQAFMPGTVLSAWTGQKTTYYHEATVLQSDLSAEAARA